MSSTFIRLSYVEAFGVGIAMTARTLCVSRMLLMFPSQISHIRSVFKYAAVACLRPLSLINEPAESVIHLKQCW